MPLEEKAIEVRGVSKTFRIPAEQIHTFKERALHPFRRQHFHDHEVLDAIDFDVMRGEFFGIVGRNGSGKSTLLKCMAGIYRADAGRMAIAGRLSPFIELGVGFNPDLTARDNVILNAVMMGLSPREARARFDAIVEFAELEEFIDLKLKNYSSGMQVRLAFSVMAQSDADVYLIDEVLAVGDASFQQKCFDVFYRLRRAGKTIVLVTHAMELCARFCHRAMLLNDGHIQAIGDPEEVARQYLVENFADRQRELVRGDAPAIRLVDLHLEDETGERSHVVAHGVPMKIRAVLEAEEDIRAPSMVLWLDNDEQTRIVSLGVREGTDRPLGDIRAGEWIEVAAVFDNWLPSGRHHVGFSVTRGTAATDLLLFLEKAIEFQVWGGESIHGLVTVPHHWEIQRRQREAALS